MDEKEIEALKTAKAEADARIAQLEKSVAEKDAVIEQKNQDLVGQRRKYKNVADMTQEERDMLSQKELELAERQEELERKQDEFAKSQQETRAKEIGARRMNAIKKIAGDDAELAKKIEENYALIKDSDKAELDTEVSVLAEKAFNMLGVEKPNPIDTVVNDGGWGSSAPGERANTGFADTQKGQELAKSLNLSVEAPKA